MRRAVALTAVAGGRALRRAILEIWPRSCVFCGIECQGSEDSLCAGCNDDLPWLDAACPCCAVPMPDPAADLCGECQSSPPAFDRATAALRYAFPVDAAIRRLKFHRRLEYAPVFGELLVARIEADIGAVDALLPVPLNWRRRFARGFNQALELSRPLAAATGLPILTEVRRIRATPLQSGLPAAARPGNVAGAFQASRPIEARHVLVIDDVMTTGATCGAVATALYEAGVDRVSVLVLARAQPGLKA